MPPPLPSPSASSSQGRSTAAQARRTSIGVSQSRTATPKQAVGSGSGGLKSAKVRGSSDKENGGHGSGSGNGSTGARSAVRRGSSANVLAAREKIPSKDGTVQRNAKEVEGLKDYQLGQCLGRGAFGSVYQALNWSNGETVAIKQVRLSDMAKTELNVIMQEIDLLKNLHHPNIVKYHGFVKSADSLYIILEYCEQGSLHQICKNFGKFPENLVALYIAQVLQGLLFLHEQGVIHRDIKGANILTTKEGLVKLADFGVATKQGGLAEGSVVGTPYWMAPEVIELSGATTASDIWSLGCTVIELLDGRPPYYKFAPMPALFRIVNDDHPPLPEGASPLVRDFLMQCFQKDPNLRVSAKKLLKHPWIVSAKKADKTKPTEYDEAIKSVQQWNEALKASPPPAQSNNAARKPSGRTGSRPVSRSSAKSGLGGMKSKTDLAPKPAFRLGPRKSQAAESFQSPQQDVGRDNWDDDFESLNAGMRGLQIPDHLKPQDNFAGLFSSEKLKRFAHIDAIPEMDGKVEEWDEEFEGDLTVKSDLQLSEGNAVETVRPFYPSRTTSDEIKHHPPVSLAAGRKRSVDHERKSSKDSQPRTQILRPASRQSGIPKVKSAANQPAKKASRPISSDKERFREEDEEDYSDLVPNDEDAFLKKVAGFSPSRFGPNDVRNMPTKLGGSMKRRRTHTPTMLVHDAAAMRRTRSSLEIQKYAEDDEDEDFHTDLVFDEEPMSLQSAKEQAQVRRGSPRSMGSGSSGTLKLTHSLSWGEDEEDDEEDPFKALEEELDEVDLESNVARDKHARLCAAVESLVSDLKAAQPEDVLAEIVDQLLQILSESIDVKNVIVSSHGMLPILEILETTTRPGIILRLLKILNAILYDNIEIQENLCFVGGIPIITRFAQKKYASEIRLEAANFVRMMYQTPTPGLTLQMFISCGGLNVLVEFLEEDYDSEAGRELVLVGVNGIWSVFELQGPTPKNDFCRIFSRSAVLYPLSLVLNRVLDEDDRELADVIEGRIVNIFLLFSQAENHVKELIAERMVLKRVLKDLRRLRPANQIVMLKFIKNLSMLATTLEDLQNSNAIEVLTDLLGSSMEANRRPTATGAQHFRDISNQILATMYNLCRLSNARQEDAALNGIVPLLQKIVKTERPLKEFALPIICDMAHSGKVGRKILWQNKGLQFYVSLLADQYWAVTALDAIFIWLQEETAKVEEYLLDPALKFSQAVAQSFNESKADAFENLLEPLQKLLRLSPAVAASLAQLTLFERAAVKMHSKKALVRLNLLRVIRSICDACEGQGMIENGTLGEGGSLLRSYGLLDAVRELARHDPAILVREMANELVKSSELADVRPAPTPSRANPYGLSRRSSSGMSMMTPPTPLAGSIGGVNGRNSSYFDLMPHPAIDRRQSAVGLNHSARPMSRDGSSGSSSSLVSLTSLAAPMGSASRSSSRVPVGRERSQRPASRMSLAPVSDSLLSPGRDRGEQQITPTHIPPSAGTRSAVATQQQHQLHRAGRRRGTGQTSVDLSGNGTGR
ncbi:Cytokinesis protein sepH [Pseudocercospora fuligena]|uniref:non-specific serine/threonine protein kinase n=1 Tax=Pseudocercospora fuligena TaxID=685502 RepID=A0A8H6VL51_9PEZI|nr:Cytokinesis protein sepH [Pseudocercospora fuligena]